jgi:hypothetical protein
MRGSVHVRTYATIDGKTNPKWGDECDLEFQRFGDSFRVSQMSQKFARTRVYVTNDEYSFRADRSHGTGPYRLVGLLATQGGGSQQVMDGIDGTYLSRTLNSWREVWPAPLEEIAKAGKFEKVDVEGDQSDPLVRFTLQCKLPEFKLEFSRLELLLWPAKSWALRQARFSRAGANTIIDVSYNQLPDGEIEVREYSSRTEYPKQRVQENYEFKVNSIEYKPSSAADFRLTAFGLSEPSAGASRGTGYYWIPLLCFGVAAASLAAGVIMRRRNA